MHPEPKRSQNALGSGVAPATYATTALDPAAPPSVVQDGMSWKRLAAALPSLGATLLLKFACPVCWPAYAGLLSSLGVSFLVDTRYLFAITLAFLAVALFFLGFRASRRRGQGPLLLGLAASALLLVGKFIFESNPAMFSGVGLLMSASLWNSWPRKLAASPAACCVPKSQQGDTP